MTGAEIAAALHAYVHRQDADTVTNEPLALSLSWAAVSRVFYPREAWRLAPVAVVGGKGPLPADFGRAISVSVAGQGQLRYVSVRDFTDLQADNTMAGAFTVDGASYNVAPAIESLATCYAAKLKQPTGSEANWLTINYPDVWLHAAIAEQWRHVQDYEAAQASSAHWQGLAQAAMAQSERAAQSGGGLAMKGR